MYNQAERRIVLVMRYKISADHARAYMRRSCINIESLSKLVLTKYRSKLGAHTHTHTRMVNSCIIFVNFHLVFTFGLCTTCMCVQARAFPVQNVLLAFPVFTRSLSLHFTDKLPTRCLHYQHRLDAFMIMAATILVSPSAIITTRC